jgi:hypothetical protein
MNSNKKLGLLATVWMFVIAMLSQVALALNPQQIIQEIVTMQFLSRIGLSNVYDPLEGLIRFLLLIALFAIFFKSAESLKLGRNVAITLAAVFSIMSTIFIPSSILLAAGASLGTLFGVILLAIPLGSLFMMYKFFDENPWMRVFVLGVQSYVLWEMKKYVTSTAPGALGSTGGTYGDLMANMGGVIMFVFAVTIVLLVYELFKAMPGTKPVSTENSPVLGFFSRMWNKNKHKVPGSQAKDEHKKKLKHAHRAKTTLLSEYIEEEKEHELIDEALKETEAFDAVVADAQSKGEVSVKNDFIADFELAHNAVDKASKEVRRLKKTTFREERQVKALMAEVRKMGIENEAHNGKTISVYETDLLKIHQDIMVELKKLDKEMSKSGKLGENLAKFKERGVTDPVTLGKSVKGKTCQVRLDEIRKGIDNATASLKVIETEQGRSYKEATGLVAATKKYWKL